VVPGERPTRQRLPIPTMRVLSSNNTSAPPRRSVLPAAALVTVLDVPDRVPYLLNWAATHGESGRQKRCGVGV
jgi:hypothetical protein